MSEFFYRSGLNEYGPLSSNELRKLADAGRLAASDEVRKGRGGKWISAASLQGLLPPPVRHNELAINEMDIVTGVAALAEPDSQAAEVSQQDTAVDSQAESGDIRPARPPLAAFDPRRKAVTAPESRLVQWATAVAGMCYFASFFGALMGIIRLFGDQTLLHHVFIGICFLFALIGLVAGCGISLLLAMHRR